MSLWNQHAIARDVARLIAAGLADDGAIQGCREDEIRHLERGLGLVLPSIYRQFLERVGRAAGTVLSGTVFLSARLPELRRQAERLLDQAGVPFRLADADFVFAMHQGYQFLYFTTGEVDDPAVWHFADGDAQPRRVFDHFSQWLSACISDEIAAWEGIRAAGSHRVSG